MIVEGWCAGGGGRGKAVEEWVEIVVEVLIVGVVSVIVEGWCAGGGGRGKAVEEWVFTHFQQSSPHGLLPPFVFL